MSKPCFAHSLLLFPLLLVANNDVIAKLYILHLVTGTNFQYFCHIVVSHVMQSLYNNFSLNLIGCRSVSSEVSTDLKIQVQNGLYQLHKVEGSLF